MQEPRHKVCNQYLWSFVGFISFYCLVVGMVFIFLFYWWNWIIVLFSFWFIKRHMIRTFNNLILNFIKIHFHIFIFLFYWFFFLIKKIIVYVGEISFLYCLSHGFVRFRSTSLPRNFHKQGGRYGISLTSPGWVPVTMTKKKIKEGNNNKTLYQQFVVEITFILLSS